MSARICQLDIKFTRTLRAPGVISRGSSARPLKIELVSQKCRLLRRLARFLQTGLGLAACLSLLQPAVVVGIKSHRTLAPPCVGLRVLPALHEHLWIRTCIWSAEYHLVGGDGSLQ